MNPRCYTTAERSYISNVASLGSIFKWKIRCVLGVLMISEIPLHSKILCSIAAQQEVVKHWPLPPEKPWGILLIKGISCPFAGMSLQWGRDIMAQHSFSFDSLYKVHIQLPGKLSQARLLMCFRNQGIWRIQRANASYYCVTNPYAGKTLFLFSHMAQLSKASFSGLEMVPWTRWVVYFTG